MIHVIATIELVEGRRAAFLAEFQRLVPLVRAEAGCLAYGPALDVEGLPQSPARPHVVVVIEQWRDLAALQAHLQAPHMIAYRPRVKDFVIRTTLQVLQPA